MPKVFLGQPVLVAQGTSNEKEFRMRSPRQFTASVKCPCSLARRQPGEPLHRQHTRDRAPAKAAGRDVEAILVPGDHFSMTQPTIPLAVTFFQQQR